ncbi:cytochrome P450 [Schizophyllum commune]
MHLLQWSTYAGATATILLAWHYIRRLWMHPLSSHQGPRLAAITKWYRAYFDLICDGGWLEHLEKLHSRYGPVVRVAPSELHFSDPSAYSDIYGFSKLVVKDPELYGAFDQDLSSFGQVDPVAAKARRDTLGPLFSRQGIRKFEFVVQDKVDHLIERLLAEGKTGSTVNLFLAFRSFSFDTVMTYSFATSYGSLDYAGFAHPTIPTITSSVTLIWYLRYFPFLRHIVRHVPRALTGKLWPMLGGYFDLFDHFSRRIDQVQEDPACLDGTGHDTIFHHLLIGKKERPTKKSLMDEAVTLLGAGSETTGAAITYAVFHVLQNDGVRDKLVKELKEAWLDTSIRLHAQDLAKLPYLTAVIKETLRLSHGVVTPAPRVVTQDTVVAGHPVPAGTTVAIGVTFVHLNPQVYTDPETFRPERWLEEGADALESAHFVPFSRGSRMCLGHNLAWCEMYLVLASIFRKTTIRIHDTDENDFKYRQYWMPIFRGRQFQGFVERMGN